MKEGEGLKKKEHTSVIGTLMILGTALAISGVHFPSLTPFGIGL
jgi:hypothetical protein